jgi:lipopolysaccharide transport system ATP-binding protein
MRDAAIYSEGISKLRRIGGYQPYKALREIVTDAVSAPFRRLRSGERAKAARSASAPETFWALDDVSFSVASGDVVGIIGRNGAGKSTLLKILSRITAPTRGFARIRGRVGSLLEVGTGFNTELTGRENTYLNGAILGMRKAEIDRKFDEIVAFAEIEKFLDTPVKHYSTGMYMRLAFAVAAHLEPEILLVDEVLAVGDAQFQKKCFSKMQEIGRGGRTILFVSHNMSAVRTICSRGIVLKAGRLVDQGEINDVVDRYLADVNQDAGTARQIETPSFKVHSVHIRSRSGPVIKTFDPVAVSVDLTPKVDIVEPQLAMSVQTRESMRLSALEFTDFESIPPLRAGQRVELTFLIESLPLLHGTYQLEMHLKDPAAPVEPKCELLPQMFVFDVVETPVYGGRKIDGWFGSVGLKVRPSIRFPETEHDQALVGAASSQG